MSADLVAFLRARLDEDERIARAAGGRSEQAWEADLSGKDPLGLPSWPVAVRYVTDGRLRGGVANLPVTNERSEDRMVHIARHDPARVLAEVAGKRQLCTLWETAERNAALPNPEGSPVYPPGVFVNGYASALGYALKLAAAPYAAVEGYRPEWAPDA